MIQSVNMVLRGGIRMLTPVLGEAAIRDARVLMAEVIGVEPGLLTPELSRMLTPADVSRFEYFIRRRMMREPVARILGRRLFWGRSFEVTADVLDPRPETETLVSLALGRAATQVLDLGTGSGCILASLLAEWPGATGTGTDISGAALSVARRNADRHGLGARADFLLSDWFSAVEGRFDLILSNPPYIAATEMPALAPEVHDHDPQIALTPGGDGLSPYRAIAAGAGAHLVDGGRLMVEIGPTQGAEVASFLSAAGFAAVAVHPDMDGRDRVVTAEKR